MLCGGCMRKSEFEEGPYKKLSGASGGLNGNRRRTCERPRILLAAARPKWARWAGPFGIYASDLNCTSGGPVGDGPMVLGPIEKFRDEKNREERSLYDS